MADLETNTNAVLAAIARAPRRDGPLLAGIAGPPGSGKSTLARKVVDNLDTGERNPPMAALVPMDGFHLDNEALDALGLRAVKGAPETFDAAGFVSLVRKLREPAEDIRYPLFDRAADRTLPDAGLFRAGTPICVVEGNYLLLPDSPWAALAPLFDVSVMIATPTDVLEDRLIQRWLDHGLPRDAARRRARGNDMTNARRVLESSATADLVLT